MKVPRFLRVRLVSRCVLALLAAIGWAACLSPNHLTTIDSTASASSSPSRGALRECRRVATRLRQLPFERRRLLLRAPAKLSGAVPPWSYSAKPGSKDLDLRRLELIAFGFIDPAFPLGPFLTRLYAEQLGGSYDPRRDELRVKPGQRLEAGATADPSFFPVMSGEADAAGGDFHSSEATTLPRGRSLE